MDYCPRHSQASTGASYWGISPKSTQAFSVARGVEDGEECKSESNVDERQRASRERERSWPYLERRSSNWYEGCSHGCTQQRRRCQMDVIEMSLLGQYYM